MKVIGNPKGFRIGRKGNFWYDFFYYCENCVTMFSQDIKFKTNGKGGPICPECEGPLRTRLSRSKSRSKYREYHSKRINI